MRARNAALVAVVALLVACGGESGGADATASPETTTQTRETQATTSTPSTTAVATTQAAAPTVVEGDGCAHVIDGSVTPSGDAHTVSATVRSADTGEEKYADRWEVRTAGGQVLGERILAHPHVNEQPFTRSLTGLAIPDDVDEVVLIAHDSVVGFCGDTYTVAVER